MKWIKQNQWLLVVQQELRETHAPVYVARRNGMLVSGIGVAVILITALWMTRYLFRLLEKVQRQKESLDSQFLQASKLATIGEMATGVAHEINNPLAIIYSEQTNIGDLLLELDPADERVVEMKGSVAQTRKQVERCKAITQKMLQFGRQQFSQGRRVDLGRELNELVRLLRPQAHLSNAEVCLEVEGQLPWIFIDPGELQQVITNLVHNALHAMARARGGILICAWKQGKTVVITIEDSGPGIPE
ncbi:MAG: hypothetical protein HY815_16405 [Candidatus Riflebacteria bacterium]|nr:hypothetical protein [Candidatus Riflebacteria bacterium]